MPANQPARIPQAAAPARGITQTTSVEMQRATAEVLGAILAAQQVPRFEAEAITDMQRACQQLELAEVAFFAVPRGGSTVNGESIHLARELARCWGNFQYGITELDRDDGDRATNEAGESQMLAWAWDVQKNSRSSTAFVVPHKRGGKTAGALWDVDDIYLNNANYGARRVREMILALLPRWYVAQASNLCRETVKRKADEEPLPMRVAKALKTLAGVGVSQARAEAKTGLPVAEWTTDTVLDLGVLYRSITEGSINVGDAFPPIADDTAPAATDQAAPAAGGPAEAPTTPSQPTQRDLKGIARIIGKAGFTGDVAKLVAVTRLLDLDAPIASLSELDAVQASEAHNLLRALEGGGDDRLREGVDALLPGDDDPVWGDATDARARYDAAKKATKE